MAIASVQSVSRSMELRHLSIGVKVRLSEILDSNESWAKLMEFIPKNITDIQQANGDLKSMQRKYSTDNIRMITEESQLRKDSPTMILLEEWGTSGKKRATVGDLLDLLVHVELFRAADYVAQDLLDEARPARPTTGPAAPYPIIDPDELELQAIGSFIGHAQYPDTSALGRQENRSHMNNRANSQSDYYVDLVKPMEGIGLSTRDDNLPDLSGIVFNARSELNESANRITSDGGQTNGSQTTKSAYSTNGTVSDDVSNGVFYEDSVNGSFLMPNLDALLDQTGDSTKISITPMNSLSESDDDQVNTADSSLYNIPNISLLLGTSKTNGGISNTKESN